MAKLLSGTRIYGNATVDTSITVGTNVAAANVVITNASRLGTVTSGTWTGSSISTTYTDAKVTTVAGQTGAISNAQLASAVSASGILTTANVTEVTNLYFTNARSRTSISTTGTKGSYNNSTGVFDFANIANVNVTSSAPSSPNIGDQWIDNATAKTFIYFNDGTSSQWVEQLFNAVYYADVPTTMTVRLRTGTTTMSVPLTNGNLPVRNRNGSTSNVIIS